MEQRFEQQAADMRASMGRLLSAVQKQQGARPAKESTQGEQQRHSLRPLQERAPGWTTSTQQHLLVEEEESSAVHLPGANSSSFL